MSAKLREKYGEYLVAHKDSGMRLGAIAFHEVDAWHAELKRIKQVLSVNSEFERQLLDNVELRRVMPNG